MFVYLQILPVVIGIAALLTVAVAAHFYFTKIAKAGKNGKKKLRTLLDSTQKYLLPLIEKEEISHDTKRKNAET